MGLACLVTLGAACSTSSGSGTGYAGAAGSGQAGSTTSGCTATPDCSGCRTCYEICVCAGSDPAFCGTQCGAGGQAGTGPGGAGPGGTGPGGAGPGGTGPGGAGGIAGSSTGGTGFGGTGVSGSSGSGFGGAGGSFGGTGGSGFGGSGGTNSGMCQVGLQNPQCNACMQTNCCAPAEGCFLDAACQALTQCLQNCPMGQSVQTCVNGVCAANANGLPALTPYLQCMSPTCDSACGG